MRIFLNCLCNSNNTIEGNNIISFIVSNEKDNSGFEYYENNDVELDSQENIKLISNLPFITTEDKVIDYMSGKTNVYFRKNTTDENFINFIKTFIHGNKFNNIEVYTPMSIENFIVFKNKLMSYYEEPSKLINILTSENNKEGMIIDYDVVKKIIKDDYEVIKSMKYFPYEAVTLSLDHYLSLNRGMPTHENILKIIEDNKDQFILKSKFYFNLMKICLNYIPK